MNIGDILINTYYYGGISNTFYMVVDKTPKSVKDTLEAEFNNLWNNA